MGLINHPVVKQLLHEEWTKRDWRDLLNTMRRLEVRIARRHAKVHADKQEQKEGEG